MAATTFSTNASRNALAISVYFGGGGLGILLTAVSLPLLLETWGPTAWPYTWWSLAIGSALALPTSWWATKDFLRRPQRDSENGVRLRWDNILPSLTSYFLFGAGYIVYMTFIVAWMRGDGAGVWTVITTWATLGVAVMASSFLWRPLMAAYQSGMPLALSTLATGIGAVLPLVYGGWDGLILSAAIFGLSFFIVPSAVTTFSRKNMPQELWGGRGCALHHHFRHWPHDRPHRRRLDRGCDRQPDRRFAAGRGAAGSGRYHCPVPAATAPCRGIADGGGQALTQKAATTGFDFTAQSRHCAGRTIISIRRDSAP